ncbi:hypothetical protein KP509_06G034700 [Ceratopteris richardii]|nr:hypothetical protein KP509_06G034700 [Ceratopteris richardii]
MYLSLLDAPWFTWNAEMHAEIVALLTSSKQLAQAQHLLESVDENLSVKQRLYFNRMLIHQYARFHLRDEVMCVFEYLQALSPSSVGPSSLTSLLHAYAIMDLPHEALAILRKMQQQMLNPSLNDFKAVLFSLGKCDMFPEMEMLAAEMNEVNMLNNLAVYNMLITTYASAENHGKVKDWLHRLLMAGLNPSVRTLNAIAKACRVLIQVSCSKTFVKAGVLSEYLRTKGAKDGELEIVELLLELCPIDEVVTWGSRWELDLHSTNMESAYILLCCWFEEVSKKLDIKQASPSEIAVVTGWGKHSDTRGLSPIKVMVRDLLESVKSPFKLDTQNKGRLLAKPHHVVTWFRLL